MKKCTMYVLMFVVVCSFLFFYAGSCNNGLDYYVKFTATSNEGSDEIVLGLGIEGYSENAFANVINGSSTLFVAISESDITGGMSGSSILIVIDGIQEDTYTSDGVINEFSFDFSSSGASYDLLSGTINVSSFGEVGDTIEGTFEGSIGVPRGLKAFSEVPLDIVITNGSFRVKRIENDAYNPFAN